MRIAVGGALVAAGFLSGCAYHPVPPDPIRYVDSPADVRACRALGSLGPPVSTEGSGPFLYGSLTVPVPATSPAAAPVGGTGVQPASDHFGIRLQAMRDEALNRGATDLLLVRRGGRDWSLVEGRAYRCPR